MKVTDIRAILLSSDDPTQTWAYPSGRATGTIITYRFLNRNTLSETDYPEEDPRVLTAAQKQIFRDAFEQFEAVANLQFVEVGPRDEAMLGIHNAERPGALGYSEFIPEPDVAPDSLLIVIKDRDDRYSILDRETVLHEIGHAVGLDHPFDGSYTLPNRLDNTDVTIMAYDQGETRALELRDLDIEAIQSLYGTGDSAGRADVVTSGSGPDLRLEITLGAGADRIVAPWHDCTIKGRQGDDWIWARHGDDDLFGNQGEDRLFGGRGDDDLLGQKADDFLRGGAGADLLVGGSGADRLTGGKGWDMLEGGTGADTFVFAAAHAGGRDVIRDFDAAADRLVFKAGIDVGSATTSSVSGGDHTRLDLSSSEGELTIIFRDMSTGEVDAALGLA